MNAYKAVAAIAPAPPPPRASPPPAAPPPAPAVRRPLKKVVKKRVMCLRRRTIKVPGTQVAKYKKKGAKLGACKPKKKKHP
ncbi:MAG TPA: hypothetical protein VKC52_05475 [Acidimicrobiia bacterium]|nr:hypothetical protein [Acidimicrobiia bacterium]